MRKLLRILACAAVAAAVAGCGAFVKVAYNNSDTALRFLAHDYFDIDGTQSEVLQSSLHRFHEWHRNEELPRYAALFDESSKRVGRGLQRADMLWAIETVRTRYRHLADRGVEEAMPALSTLNADNIVALEQKFAEKNEEFRREFLKGDQSDREKAQMKAYSKRLSDWIGDLDPAQERLTLEFIRAHPKASEIKLAERKRRQQEMLALLRNTANRPQLSEKLHDYFNNFERNRPAEFAEAARRFENDFVDYMVAIDRTLTPAQRERAVQKFARYAQDFRTLAAEGRNRKDAASLAANSGAN